MITGRPELTVHGLRLQPAPSTLLRVHRNRVPRALYTGEPLRDWFREVLPGLQSTAFSTGYSPLIEAKTVLGRFAAGARLYVEPDEKRRGDIKCLDPHSNRIWELKTGDVRIFGWFHEHDCFVAYSGDDATELKATDRYEEHITAARHFMAQCGLQALAGDHRSVLTL